MYFPSGTRSRYGALVTYVSPKAVNENMHISIDTAVAISDSDSEVAAFATQGYFRAHSAVFRFSSHLSAARRKNAQKPVFLA